MSERTERYSALYEREQAAVLLFVARRCASWSQAEDITNDVFLTAWQRFDAVPHDPGQARGWLMNTARNHLRNLYRRNERQPLFQSLGAAEAVPVQPPPDNAVVANAALASAWGTLSPADQEVIALTAWDELDSAQAGAVLGISAATYRRRLSRARKALRRALELPAPRTRVQSASGQSASSGEA